MNVSSGKYKGRRLLDNPYDHIRPTADMVKQAIFNKIFQEVVDAKVLDLFCGTGALGIEAISRGAGETVFCDKDIRSVKLTRANLDKLGLKAEVYCVDYKTALKRLAGRKFDIILLDPPYHSGIYEDCLKLIREYDVLQENGIIICEQEKTVQIDYSPFEIVDQKRYGIKLVTYLTK